MGTAISKITNGVLNTLIPPTCFGCKGRLSGASDIFCTICRHQLPTTGFDLLHENPVDDLFAATPSVHKAAAWWVLEPYGPVHNVLHALKYRGYDQVGHRIGEMLGPRLARDLTDADIDGVLSVPLHPIKRMIRGYDQVSGLARGLAQSVAAPYSDQVLRCRRYRKGQARRGRHSRTRPAEGRFQVVDATWVTGRSLLLVDDVVTTGSTLSACTEALSAHSPARILVVALAWAPKVS